MDLIRQCVVDLFHIECKELTFWVWLWRNFLNSWTVVSISWYRIFSHQTSSYAVGYMNIFVDFCLNFKTVLPVAIKETEGYARLVRL